VSFFKIISCTLVCILIAINLMAMEIELAKSDGGKPAKSMEVATKNQMPDDAKIDSHEETEFSRTEQDSTKSSGTQPAANSLQFNDQGFTPKQIAAKGLRDDFDKSKSTSKQSLILELKEQFPNLEDKSGAERKLDLHEQNQVDLVSDINSQIYDYYTVKILKLDTSDPTAFTTNSTELLAERDTMIKKLTIDIQQKNQLHRSGDIAYRQHEINDMFKKMITDSTKPITAKYQDAYKKEQDPDKKTKIAEKATQEICDAMDPTGLLNKSKEGKKQIQAKFEADYGPHWYDAIVDLIMQLLSPKTITTTNESQPSPKLTISSPVA